MISINNYHPAWLTIIDRAKTDEDFDLIGTTQEVFDELDPVEGWHYHPQLIILCEYLFHKGYDYTLFDDFPQPAKREAELELIYELLNQSISYVSSNYCGQPWAALRSENPERKRSTIILGSGTYRER